MNSSVTLTFPVTLESSLTNDGQLFSFPSFTIDAPSYTFSYPGFSGSCGEAYASNRWYRACNQHNEGDGWSFDYMNVSVGVRGGTVTYDGWNVSTMRYPDLGQVYVYESNYGPFTQSTDDPLYPLPENLGVTLEIDRGNVVKSVVDTTPAAAIGLKAGDLIRRLNGVPIHSFGDAQFALDRAPRTGSIEIAWQRG